MTTPVHTGGFTPTVKIEPANPEAEKYLKIWSHAAYRAVSPGEAHVMNFMTQAQPPLGSTIIDFGCGTGRAGLILARMGMKVTLVDFVKNCLDENVREAVDRGELQWLKWDLTRRLPIDAEYGFCTDVMEHIPPEDVQRVLANILGSARKVYFNIDNVPDAWGPILENTVLHLTVREPAWWLAEVKKLGGKVHWAREDVRSVSMYLSAWKDAGELIEGHRINCDIEQVEAQTQANIRAGWRHIGPWGRQDRELCVLCGGPSLKDSLDKINELRAEGAGIVTLNGSYHWALDHGLEPGVQIVLDAREFNNRFTRPVTAYTQYLVASQAHPSTLEGLPHERTFLWHSGISTESEQLVKELTGSFYPIPGGSTVALRAMALLRMMGFYRLHFFGFDSCVNGSHHAYPQAENDGEQTIPVSCGGRYFQCTPWMVSQAHEFRGLVGFLGDEVELAVHGDGLIAHMIRTGAELSRKEN